MAIVYMFLASVDKRKKQLVKKFPIQKKNWEWEKSLVPEYQPVVSCKINTSKTNTDSL